MNDTELSKGFYAGANTDAATMLPALAALQLEMFGSHRARESAVRQLTRLRSTGTSPLVAPDGLFEARQVADDATGVNLRILTSHEGLIDTTVLDRVDDLLSVHRDLVDVEVHVVLDGADRIWSAFYRRGIRSEPWEHHDHQLEDVVIEVSAPLRLLSTEVDGIRTTEAVPALFAPRETARAVFDDFLRVRYQMRLRDQGFTFAEAFAVANPHVEVRAKIVARDTDKVAFSTRLRGDDVLEPWSDGYKAHEVGDDDAEDILPSPRPD